MLHIYRCISFLTQTMQYSSHPKIDWVPFCPGRFQLHPKMRLLAWNSDTMSNFLPKKDVIYCFIASRNANYEALHWFSISSWPRPKIHRKPTLTTIKWKTCIVRTQTEIRVQTLQILGGLIAMGWKFMEEQVLPFAFGRFIICSGHYFRCRQVCFENVIQNDDNKALRQISV